MLVANHALLPRRSSAQRTKSYILNTLSWTDGAVAGVDPEADARVGGAVR